MSVGQSIGSSLGHAIASALIADMTLPQPGDYLLNELAEYLTDESNNRLTA